MARPESNTVDYFPHRIGDGKKIFYIEQKYQNDGYATWYKILEKMARTDYHYLDFDDENEIMFLAAKCHISEEKLLNIITDLVRLKVFDKDLWDDHILWCQDFVDSLQEAYRKRNNKSWNIDSLRRNLLSIGRINSTIAQEKGDSNPQSKVKESKVNKKECIRIENPQLFPDDFIDKKFELFWDLYDNKKDKKAAYDKFKKLTKNQIENLLLSVPIYQSKNKDKNYWKLPKSLISSKIWEDEEYDPRKQEVKQELTQKDKDVLAAYNSPRQPITIHASIGKQATNS